MSYRIDTVENKIVCVVTSDEVALSEREKIVEDIGDLLRHDPDIAVVVDHREANFTLTPEQALEFSEKLTALSGVMPMRGIYVIPSERNRVLIDMTISAAAALHKLTFSVCLDMDEVQRKVAERSA